MSEVTIGQMNYVIAKFMSMEGSADFIRQNYAYHKHWQMLMPVVEKIATIEDGKFNINISSTGQWPCYINRDDVFDSEIASYGGFEPVIINVFKAVYQFIQWYNKQKEHGKENK